MESATELIHSHRVIHPSMMVPVLNLEIPGIEGASNGSAGEPWPAGPSVPSAGSTAAGGRNQRGSPADPFARPSAVGRTNELGTRQRDAARADANDAPPSTLAIRRSLVHLPPVIDQFRSMHEPPYSKPHVVEILETCTHQFPQTC